jgi:chloramphenicol 3-O-phosphotransferase
MSKQSITSAADMAGHVPLLVLVSGAPGSGKSTFGRALADHMRLMHIDRDALFYSLSYTQREPVERKVVGITAYYDTLIWLLRRGFSLVTDGTMYPGISEQDIRDKLMPIARVVNVHCSAEGQRERFYTREINRPTGKPAWLDNYMEHVDKVIADTAAPLSIGCEQIEVNTTAAYVPSVAEIATQLEDRNNIPVMSPHHGFAKTDS